MIQNQNLILKNYYNTIVNRLFKCYYNNYKNIIDNLTREDIEEIIHDSILRYFKIYDANKSKTGNKLNINFAFLKKIFIYRIFKLNYKFMKRNNIYKKFVHKYKLFVKNQIDERVFVKSFIEYIIYSKIISDKQKKAIYKRIKLIHKKELSNYENKLFYTAIRTIKLFNNNSLNKIIYFD